MILIGRGRGKMTERASGQRAVVGIATTGAALEIYLHHVGYGRCAVPIGWR
jgi:hypothetical protein